MNTFERADGEYRPEIPGENMSAVVRNNNTLSDVRKQVTEAEGSLREEALEIPIVIAETRWLTAGLSRKGLEALASEILEEKLDDHAVSNAENPHGQTQHETHSVIYRLFRKMAEDASRFDAPTRTALERQAARLLDLLVPATDDYERPWADTVVGKYWRWKYMKGSTAFDEATAASNKRQESLTYGALWQRHEAGVIPDFHEPLVIAQTLEVDEEELAAMKNVWRQQKAEQLRARAIPESMIELMMEAQLKIEGLCLTQESLREHLDITCDAAKSIAKYRMVPREQIDALIEQVIEPKLQKRFRSDWDRALEAELGEETFRDAFYRIRDGNGWNNAMIAKLFHIRPPEERAVTDEEAPKTKRKKKATRKEPYRPSHAIRDMAESATHSNQAPAKAVVDLVASDDLYEKGETQREYLERLFKEQANRRFELDNSGLHDSQLRLHRLYCGVTAEQLSEASGKYSADEIMLIERGRKEISVAETDKLMKLSEAIPATLVAQAHLEMNEIQADPVTVAEVVPKVSRRIGGRTEMGRKLKDPKNQMHSITKDRLARIERGEEFATLPDIQRILKCGDYELTDELRRDWYETYTEQLAQNPDWEHPLARGFAMLVFEEYRSLKEFWEEEFKDDFSHSVLTRNFRQLNGEGYNIDWPTASRYINARGIPLRDDRRLWLQKLFGRKADMDAAYEQGGYDDVLKIVRAELRAWRMEADDAESVEHTLGLTAEERGIRK